MKLRSKINLILLLVPLFFLSACANDQYSVERQYWYLQKQAGKIFQNPQGSPPGQLNAAVNRLNKFIQKHPKSSLSTDAEFNIARLYMVKEEYNKARAQLKMIEDKYTKYPDIRAEAVFLSGNSYQMENKWDSALNQYRKIMQLYPVTRRGLDVPVYIAQYYKVKHQPEKMIVAFQEAIVFYKGLAAKYPNSPLAYVTSMLAADCYGANKDWQGAINSLNTMLVDYKGKVQLDNILMNIAAVYYRELKDKTKTKETLERLLKEYPHSKYIKAATALLKELSK